MRGALAPDPRNPPLSPYLLFFSGLQSRCASFDRLRMSSFLHGIEQMPVRIFLILSLSKDAPR